LLILKSIIYRVLRILLLLIVSFIILGNINTALSISLLDALIATIYYYYFDIVWEKITPSIKELGIRIKYRKFNERKL